ncbi:MAG: MAPEG family protein [Deltaproteobacteria bacterium]|nr:MAG: MAPEG family protein [Deltaproteobacteria bacterium]
MTTELTMLAASAGLAWILIMTAALPKILSEGMGWAFGNRAETPPGAPWVERATRAHANLHENLIIFAILVLVAHVAGRSSDASATGAVIFFAARVAHALVYIAGIPGLRTLVWAVSVGGMFMVASALLP